MNTPVLDHLVLASPNLAAAVSSFAARAGVQPTRGGSHVGLGTANFLVDLGGGGYLEIIGPDPDQPSPEQPRPFGIDELTEPRLVTWAVRTDDLDLLLAQARDANYHPGEPISMSRRTADGQLLEWRIAPPHVDHGDGLVPFFIDWGSSPHPTGSDLPRAPLRGLRGTHPDPASVRPALAALGIELPLDLGEAAGLIAVIEGVDGPLTL